MSDEKKIVITNAEQAENFLRSSIALIPGAGGFLNEIIFNQRARLKQKRINSFIVALSDYLIEYDIENFDTSKVDSEYFGDIFETVLLNVAMTSSESKRKRFKTILGREFISPSNDDYKNTFINLVQELSENQIIFLSKYYKDSENIKSKFSQYSDIDKELQESKQLDPISSGSKSTFGRELNKRKQITNENLKKQTFEDISEVNNKIKQIDNLSPEVTELIIDDLIGKGLMKREPLIGIGSEGHTFEMITSLGQKFIEYLREN